MEQRVLVCGGRGYMDTERLCAVLDAADSANPISHIISGMAYGADTHAIVWATARGIPISRYPADWKKHGKAAGPIRNQQMLDEGKPDIVIAFPGGKGTDSMIRLAEAAGVPVVKITDR